MRYPNHLADQPQTSSLRASTRSGNLWSLHVIHLTRCDVCSHCDPNGVTMSSAFTRRTTTDPTRVTPS